MKHLRNYFNRYKKQVLPPYTTADIPVIALTLILSIGLIATVFFLTKDTNLFSKAATINSVEPESGTITGNVTVVSDATSSGGKYVRFGTVAPTPTPAPNLVQNGSFETTGTGWYAPWIFNAKTGTTSTITQDSSWKADGLYSALINTTAITVYETDIQLYQTVALTANQSYTLSFSAKSSINRNITMSLVQSVSPWAQYITEQTFNLTATPQTYTVTVTPNTTDPNAWIMFNFGQSTGQVWIDNITLTPNGTGPVSTASPTASGPTPTLSAGPGYYVDCNNGNDSNNGRTSSAAWRTLSAISSRTFAPGDTIYLIRGCSWDGGLNVRGSGASGNPITVTAYGSGNAPSIQNSSSTVSNWAPAVDVSGNYVVIDGLYLHDTLLAGVRLETGTSHNIVRNSEIYNTGFGVEIDGNYNLITHNYAHDLHLIVNTPTSVNNNDDFGAVGYNINGTDNEISYNRCFNCQAPSYDYGYDGGFVEVYNNGDNTNVHHNWAEMTNGFFELGAANPTYHANNVRVDYNVILNTDPTINVDAGSSNPYAITVTNLHFENNTIVELSSQIHGQTWPIMLFPGATPTALYSQNNIYYLNGNFATLWDNSANITHDNNLYYLTNGATLSRTLGPGEKQGDPLFVNLASKDFHLRSGSPAIDAGVNLGYTTDYDGKAVPNGSVPDMGAFEY